MLSVESIAAKLAKQKVQVLAICCDNIDSIHTWATALGGLSFPVLSDFWPHGEVSRAYGVLNKDGVPDRAMVLLDDDGKICYLDERHADEIPPTEPMLAVLGELTR